MKNKKQARYDVQPTCDYRGNAKDARYKRKLDGEPAVACKLQQTGDVARYIAVSTWFETVDAKTAAAVKVGKMNSNGLRYQCFIETKSASIELHANMLAANGNAPLWFATENGYCSPNFANAKWHDKIESVFDMLTAGKITVVITDDETGELFDTVSIAGTKDQLGRFVKKDETGKIPFLVLIDKATEPRKGYLNHPQRKRFEK